MAKALWLMLSAEETMLMLIGMSYFFEGFCWFSMTPSIMSCDFSLERRFLVVFGSSIVILFDYLINVSV